MKNISSEEARLLGVDTVYQIMDNEDKRFRLVNNDGSSYIRTEGSKHGSWQNSHYHKHLNELYIVEDGWIVYAELTDQGGLSLKLMEKNDSFIVSPLLHHNIYMSSLAVTHVVKYGGNNGVEPDWFPSPQLDRLTKDITESELVRMVAGITGNGSVSRDSRVLDEIHTTY